MREGARERPGKPGEEGFWVEGNSIEIFRTSTWKVFNGLKKTGVGVNR